LGVTFTPVFNRIGTKNKSGYYSIHLRVTIDRKSNYINPKLPKIKKEFWSGKQNKWVKESHPGSFEMNSLLQRQITELDKFILKLKLYNRPVTFNQIKEFYFKKGDGTVLNEYIDEYIKNIKGLDLNTIKAYKTFQKHFDSFISNVKFSELSEHLIDSFKNYLQIEKGLKGAATKKYFDKFKVICNDAVKNGYLDANQNPFLYYSPKIKVEKPTRIYLEVEEIKAIKNIKFLPNEKHLEVHRDHFLFQVYSGMYYRDLKKLKKDNLLRNNNGYYIIDDRSKNSNKFIIPLYKFPYAEKIIGKYWNDTDLIFTNTISDQKYNSALKTIAGKAKIKKNLTNKVGRHTNVQLWMAMGIERQFVSKMVGHTKESTTQVYYDMSIKNIEPKIKGVNFSKLGI